MKIQFCKRCLYSTDHPLGLTINNDGICSGCEIHEEKDFLDWDERFKKLEAIVAPIEIKKAKTTTVLFVSELTILILLFML